jgi:hypothetical protein
VYERLVMWRDTPNQRTVTQLSAGTTDLQLFSQVLFAFVPIPSFASFQTLK